jgi:rod shape-determining protein MreC
VQRILDILLLFKEYLVLTFLIVISIILLAGNDNSQLHAIRAYTVGFIGVIQNTLSVIPNVFELKRENEVLRQLNINLSDEVNRLRQARLENRKLKEMLNLKEEMQHPLISAEVIGKSLHLLRNTITLSAGEKEGVRVDMPVICEFGLVGKIIATSSHYSIGQLVINKDFRASAKVQRSRIDGIIGWDGGEFFHLKNVAKKQDIREGDLIVTSEYSSVFPSNIKIGIVAAISEKPGNLFKDVDVQPSVDYASLEQVFIVAMPPDSERVRIEGPVPRLR